jgi:hypothetical protein
MIAALGQRFIAACHVASARAKSSTPARWLKDFAVVIEHIDAVNEVGAAFHVDLRHVGSPIAMRAISSPLSSITQTTQPLQTLRLGRTQPQ